MSAVLGHIHFWLYKKIQLIAEREQIIKKEAQSRLDDLADELMQQPSIYMENQFLLIVSWTASSTITTSTVGCKTNYKPLPFAKLLSSKI